MKSNASLTLKNRFDEEIILDMSRDLVEIEKFIRRSFDVALKYPFFQEVEVRICAENLDKSVAKLLTPTHDINRLYLVVFYSTITEVRKPESLYIKWEYRHHDGIVYGTEDYVDVDRMIKMDNLLTT
jgi:hypothetical protein